MFSQVQLTHFKSFETDTRIDLRRISVFIGPNGSGKSSVLHSLLIWKQSIGRGELLTAGDLLDLGTQSDVAASADIANAQIGFTATDALRLPGLTGNENLVEARNSTVASFVSDHFSDFEVSAEPLHIKVRQEEGGRLTADPQQYEGSNISFRPRGTLIQRIEVTDQGGASPQLVRDIQQVCNMALDTLNSVRFVPALRGFGNARYPLGDNPSQDFASNTNAHNNANTLATTLAYSDQLREDVRDALQNLTEVTLDRELASDKRVAPVSLRLIPGGRPQRVVPTNEGFGTNQLIHLLAQVLVTPDGGTVLIEEPEAHLHPSVQVKLGMWLAQHARDHNKQCLITTHSEHFLAALLWQVRQEVIEPSDISVHYFNLDEADHSLHRRLDITHGGLIQGSFRDFFPDPAEIPEWSEFFRGLRR